jgi:hypothetical protein
MPSKAEWSTTVVGGRDSETWEASTQLAKASVLVSRTQSLGKRPLQLVDSLSRNC